METFTVEGAGASSPLGTTGDMFISFQLPVFKGFNVLLLVILLEILLESDIYSRFSSTFQHSFGCFYWFQVRRFTWNPEGTFSSSGLHLFTSGTFSCSCQSSSTEEQPDGVTAWTNQTPGSAPHRAGRPSSRHTAFIESQPMGAQRAAPALKPDQPVSAGLLSVWVGGHGAVELQLWLIFLLQTDVLKVLLSRVKLHAVGSRRVQNSY